MTARGYLLTVFRELAKLPGAAELVDARHNPVWVLAPSPTGAEGLLDFFRNPNKQGEPAPEFDDINPYAVAITRFRPTIW